MNPIVCPYCGGKKATQINDHEYNCEYCGSTFKVEPPKPAPVSQPPVAPQPAPLYHQPQPAPLYQQNFTPTVSSKSRIVAALFAFFLGTFGAHHFYLGNSKKGVIYLLFFWTYIPTIVALIEAVGFLLQSDEEFARKYPG